MLCIITVVRKHPFGHLVTVSIKDMGTFDQGHKKLSSNAPHIIDFRLGPSTFFIQLTCYCKIMKDIDLGFDFVKTK